ncbi:MAG: N-acetylmuramoyl-L-alanine amidase [Sphingomonadales bacterium]|nr:N-acetylmuramoyl-L-alanine amidase [Sphingomonadales bacterium]
MPLTPHIPTPQILTHASPNFNERADDRVPDMIILHYTGMKTGKAAVHHLRNKKSSVSAHYVVEEGGQVLSLVEEAKRAWHAGLSHWAGETDINTRSIGIEIVNPGHEFGYQPFPAHQMQAVTDLVLDIKARHNIADARILGHSDVAPSRKQDPGELFDWKRLAEAGAGLWSDATEPAQDYGLEELQKRLQALGYGIAITGEMDVVTKQVVTAFQRHWLPEKLSGEVCGLTRATLDKLLEQL